MEKLYQFSKKKKFRERQRRVWQRQEKKTQILKQKEIKKERSAIKVKEADDWEEWN